MGIWEGFPSIIGYSLVLAVNISFVLTLGGKILLLTVTLGFHLGYDYEYLVFGIVGNFIWKV